MALSGSGVDRERPSALPIPCSVYSFVAAVADAYYFFPSIHHALERGVRLDADSAEAPGCFAVALACLGRCLVVSKTRRFSSARRPPTKRPSDGESEVFPKRSHVLHCRSRSGVRGWTHHRPGHASHPVTRPRMDALLLARPGSREGGREERAGPRAGRAGAEAGPTARPKPDVLPPAPPGLRSIRATTRNATRVRQPLCPSPPPFERLPWVVARRQPERGRSESRTVGSLEEKRGALCTALARTGRPHATSRVTAAPLARPAPPWPVVSSTAPALTQVRQGASAPTQLSAGDPAASGGAQLLLPSMSFICCL